MALMKANSPAQYDGIAREYTALSKKDPVKQFVQYPETLRLLGDVRGKRVLDIGCGAGLLTEQIAGRGARIAAYDISREQIFLALSSQPKNQSITYLVSSPEKIAQALESLGIPTEFDVAVSTLVLFYAENARQLSDFFKSTFSLLTKGAKFVSILFNPDYGFMGAAKFNRIFTRENGKSTVNFLDSGQNVVASATHSDFSRADYENAAKGAGFSKFEWVDLEPSIEGIEAMGKEYWADFHESPPYVGFVATKE